MRPRIRAVSKPIKILAGGMALAGILGWIAWQIFQQVEEVNKEADCTVLSSSAGSGSNDDVEERLKGGTDPNCNHGQPLRDARQGGHEDTVDLLKRYGAKE
ncbi:MAG TPA: hypothetical protein VKU00_12745 [Chthonomonadaceae bacterium]|nr:hypothetical protein [Chthonomonadaceae bacterium]